MFRLSVHSPPGQDAHWEGIFLSLLSEVSEIIAQRKKGSALIHFSKERLSRKERRQMILILERMLADLQKGRRTAINENVRLGATEMPKQFMEIFQSFGM